MTTLTLTHLQIDCVAEREIRFGRYKAGNSLRNGLANTMLRTTCPEQRRNPIPTPEHAATCPACYLLAANTDPGSITRGYSIVPPLPDRGRYQAGESFSFGITLFGSTRQYLPYFVLALGETGRHGVGYGGGTFSVEKIAAINRLNGTCEPLLEPGQTLVRFPLNVTSWQDVETCLPQHMELLQSQGRAHELKIRFETPLRLEENKRLLRSPDFVVLFKRLLWRIDWLGQQFAADEQRTLDMRNRLIEQAYQVRLVDADVEWREAWSKSSRKGEHSPFSGLVGHAIYSVEDWSPLMPFLIWGQVTQAGKSVTKGNGVYRLVSL